MAVRAETHNVAINAGLMALSAALRAARARSGDRTAGDIPAAVGRMPSPSRRCRARTRRLLQLQHSGRGGSPRDAACHDGPLASRAARAPLQQAAASPTPNGDPRRASTRRSWV